MDANDTHHDWEDTPTQSRRIIMITLNKVILIGRLGKEPKVSEKHTSLSVATDRSFKDDEGNWKDMTDWNVVMVYNGQRSKLADFHTGDLIQVEGHLESGFVVANYLRRHRKGSASKEAADFTEEPQLA